MIPNRTIIAFLVCFVVSIIRPTVSFDLHEIDFRLKAIESDMAKRILDLKSQVSTLEMQVSTILEREHKLTKLLSELEAFVRDIQKNMLHVSPKELIEILERNYNGTKKGQREFDWERYKIIRDDITTSLIERNTKRSMTVERAPTTPAFYAYMSSKEVSPSRHHTIIFDHNMLNEGHGYNPNTGIFTAPAAGIYVFSCTVNADVGALIPVEIVKNADVIGSFISYSYTGSQNTATTTVLIELNIGDTCLVRTSSAVSPSGNIFSDESSRSSISGWLLA